MTVVLPLGRNGAPGMLHPYVVPARCEGCGKGDRNSGEEEGQHGEPLHGQQETQRCGERSGKARRRRGKSRIQKTKDFEFIEHIFDLSPTVFEEGIGNTTGTRTIASQVRSATGNASASGILAKKKNLLEI
jgi:hypothetical protein